MKIENQLVEIELSKEMKELGFKQDGYWSWYTNGDSKHLLHNPEGYRPIEAKTFDAFTVAELGKKLMNQGPLPVYYNDGINGPGWYNKDIFAKNEANARAKMLIYLAKNNLINPKEL